MCCCVDKVQVWFWYCVWVCLLFEWCWYCDQKCVCWFWFGGGVQVVFFYCCVYGDIQFWFDNMDFVLVDGVYYVQVYVYVDYFFVVVGEDCGGGQVDVIQVDDVYGIEGYN